MLLLSVISISGINKAQAQNIQLFYDAGGSTFFFIDFDYSPKASGAYWEIARELNFWQDSTQCRLPVQNGLSKLKRYAQETIRI